MHNLVMKKPPKEPSNSTYVLCYKLPYIENLLTEIKQKIVKHCKYHCKSANIKIVFSTFKVGYLFGIKEYVPEYLISFVVYKLTCPGRHASYICETTHHLTTRIKEHLENDSKPYIFKHFHTNMNCEELRGTECLEIIGSPTSSYKLKLKEAMHITWDKPSLNKHVKHVSISITIYLRIVLLFFICFNIVIAFAIMSHLYFLRSLL